MVRALAVDWHIGVLIIEHDVQMVMSTSDRVMVLDFGVCVASGTPEEVCHPAVVSAYLGEAAEEIEDETDLSLTQPAASLP